MSILRAAMSISRALTGSALAPATIPDAAAIDLGSAPGGAGLRVGPILRHVGEHDATIWVETTGPARVAVRVDDVEVEARTFQVAGHTYAMVVLEGLPSGATLPYEVAVDDVTVWPAPGSASTAERHPDDRPDRRLPRDLRVMPLPGHRQGR